ncbi:YqaJ viral recombinase family protein [Corticimicrobacter populi]|uniref:Heme peroxidase n=1 Tax=Corticimicrobacter populi TaxID=2175229 RepID=A0A2V1K1P3_9BURK|nr:YqaJ viral recombinase family protein [Corticimicrobacter populi]PWF25021.1 Heme peroxidase [Corticimicrobacter populi]
MITHNVLQGSPEWDALRFKSFTASEAPVMMAMSSKMTRNDLLRMKATGTEREYSDWVQRNLFDKGHEYEAAARTILERIIGEELYPTVGTDEETGLLASFDGITMLGDAIYEHKMWNEALADATRANELPPEYFWQLEQQLLVSNADRAMFVVSDGTEENFVMMEYRPVPGRAQQLLAGWKQFAEDLQAYQPAEPELVVVGRAPENLPALRIEVTGMVTASNLREFKNHALAVIGSINRNLVTDQDFADAEKAVKWCGEVESRLAAAKQHALSQTASIDELFRTLDEISGEARATRLEVDKLVKAQKDVRRSEILTAAQHALANHVATLNKRIVPAVLPALDVNFALAMKGKRTITTLQDAADSELAKGKIQANDLADKITANLSTIRATGYAFLFADIATLAHKAPDDLQLLIAARIDTHEKDEAARLEAEREKIRKEETAKLESAAKEQQERDAAAATAQIQSDAMRTGGDPASLVPHVPSNTSVPAYQGLDFSATPSQSVTASAACAGYTRSLSGSAETATLRLGQINERLSPITLTADGLTTLGFTHSATDKAAKLYRESEFPSICAALIRHIDLAHAAHANAADTTEPVIA